MFFPVLQAMEFAFNRLSTGRLMTPAMTTSRGSFFFDGDAVSLDDDEKGASNPGTDAAGSRQAVILRLERICREFHVDSLLPQLRAGEEVLLEHGVVDVAVLGQFKAGKSSFLNDLIGRDVLPVFRSLAFRHFRKQIVWEVEKNLSRLASQWADAVNRSIGGLARRSLEFMQDEAATIRSLVENAEDLRDDIRKALAELDRLESSLT